MGTGRRRVLIVETDRSVSRMLLLSFRAAGLDTILASSGADALQVLDASQVEAVVIDPDLPDDLGRLVLDRLRETSKPHRKPLHWIVMSAQDIEHVIELYGPVGGRFFAKPFDPWDLVDILRTLSC